MDKRYYINKYSEATRPKFFIIKLILEGSQGKHNDYPMAQICVNNKSLFHDYVEGQQTIEVEVNDLETAHVRMKRSKGKRLLRRYQKRGKEKKCLTPK